MKFNVVFERSDGFFSKLIYYWTKYILGRDVKYTHVCIEYNNNIFEINNFLTRSKINSRKISKIHDKIEFTYHDKERFYNTIVESLHFKYDFEEILNLSINKRDYKERKKDKKYICSSLVSYVLNELDILDEHKIMTPNDFHNYLKYK